MSLSDIESRIDDLQNSLDDVSSGIDEMWHLFAGTMIFLMHAGFSMHESGSVRTKNSVNILFYVLLDAIVCTFFFWILGFGFAFGKTYDGFIGNSRFGLTGDKFTTVDDDDADVLDFHSFFIQWSYAATAVTIVSGGMAERTKLASYLIYVGFIAAFIYPPVVHWCWGNGWLSPFGSDKDDYLFNGRESNNFIDFAGSGVVHIVGGFSALCGAIMVGAPAGTARSEGCCLPFIYSLIIYRLID